jgi:hypothetical protein
LSAAPQSYPICLEYLFDLATGTILRKISRLIFQQEDYANFIHLSKKMSAFGRKFLDGKTPAALPDPWLMTPWPAMVPEAPVR